MAKTESTSKQPRKKGTKQSRSAGSKSSRGKAIAAGRVQNTLVRDYLQSVNAPKRRGRRVDPKVASTRLEAAKKELAGATDPFDQLMLHQEVLDLESQLEAAQAGPQELERLEKDFVAIAADYSQRRKISYGAWRAVGVPSDVLERAGVKK